MNDRMPIERRPRFARRLVAVWRKQHLATGEGLTVTIWPGEWPEGEPRECGGLPVAESDQIGGAGAVMILGRARGAWKAVYTLAVPEFDAMDLDDLALVATYMEVDDDRGMKLWLHADPESGEVPMWEIAPGGSS